MSRAGVRRWSVWRADEQAALRRVAMLVARGVPAASVFAAVAEEVGRLLDARIVNLVRYEPDGTATVVGSWSQAGGHMPIGGHWTLEGLNLATLVMHTGRPARIDHYTGASGSVAAFLQKHGVRSGVASPIAVGGRLWGLIAVLSTSPEPLAVGDELRLAEFTELVATAISNVQALAELTTSRARIVAAADQARRRIERDLHDGIQQRLVSLGLELRALEARVPGTPTES